MIDTTSTNDTAGQHMARSDPQRANRASTSAQPLRDLVDLWREQSIPASDPPPSWGYAGQ
jgi:hypothetical protein